MERRAMGGVGEQWRGGVEGAWDSGKGSKSVSGVFTPMPLPRPTFPSTSANLSTSTTHLDPICLLLICGCVICNYHEELCGGMFLDLTNIL